MGLVRFLGLRTYTVELRRDLEQLEKQFNDLVQRVGPLFSNEPSSSFTNTTVNEIGLPAAGFADPTNPVILTDTPGVLKKAMRSDGAPRLSQAIEPTWTGSHTWSPTADVVPHTILKTSGLATDNLSEILDTDSSKLIVVDNTGLFGVNCQPDTDSMVTIQGNDGVSPIPSGPLAWYKADTITDLSNGANMTTWQDSSGNGNHLTAQGKLSTGTDDPIRPKWFNAANGFGGILPGITMNINAVPADHQIGYFSIDTAPLSLTSTAGWTIAIISRGYRQISQRNIFLGSTSASDRTDCSGTGNPDLNFWATLSGITDKVYISNYFDDDDGFATEYVVLRATGTDNGPSNTLLGWVNGVAAAATGDTRGTMSWNYVGTNIVGGALSGGMYTRMLGELIVWDRRLSNAEVDQLNTYLADRIAGNPITAIDAPDLTHWNDSSAVTLSKINTAGYFGFGGDPAVPVDLILDSQQLRIGPSSTEWTGFYYTGAAQINYVLPATSTTGILHNTASVWSWSLVSLTGDVTGTLPVANGGTGATTLTGLLQGNGTSAITAITNSSTVGQILRVTGAATYAWGALDLADTDAITGDLPYANLTPSTAASKLLGRGSSGSGDWQEITLGTNLTMTGTTLDATGGGGGGSPLSVTTTNFEIATTLLNTTLGGSQASFSITGLSSAAYDYIEIEMLVRSDRAASIDDGILMTYNSDTTDAHYLTTYTFDGGGGTPTGQGDLTNRQVGVMTGASSFATAFSAVRIIIPLPSSTVDKAATAFSVMRQSTVGYIYQFGHRWIGNSGTTVVDTITLTPSLGTNFVTGSSIVAKGFKSQAVVTAASGGTHNLLDGSIHPDTLAGTVVKGDLIVGNATPKWSRFAVSGIANGSVLTRNSAATVGVEWAAAADPLARHTLCGGI